MHSGMFGGPAPDPVVGLIQMLASLHDARRQHDRSTVSTTTQTWTGVDYPAEQFRADANVLDGVELMGDGTVADMLWARPSATVLGHRRPAGDRLIVGRARRRRPRASACACRPA